MIMIAVAVGREYFPDNQAMLAGGKVLPPYDSLWAGHRDATDDAHAALQQLMKRGGSSIARQPCEWRCVEIH
ncbi:MAG: hypothetical protein LDL16_02785 [Thiobacillus sp.]|nr:hypothetical protein [Thiobacillus sp.]